MRQKRALGRRCERAAAVVVALRIAIPTLPRFQRMAQRAPDIGGRLLAQAMSAAVQLVRSEVVQRTPVGVTGLLRSSISARIEGQPLTSLRGIIATPSFYAPPVEYGRRPGRMPPPAALRLWAQRVLGDASLAFVVARAIGRRGTRGRFMFREGFRAARPRVLALFREARDRLVTDLRRGS